MCNAVPLATVHAPPLTLHKRPVPPGEGGIPWESSAGANSSIHEEMGGLTSLPEW